MNNPEKPWVGAWRIDLYPILLNYFYISILICCSLSSYGQESNNAKDPRVAIDLPKLSAAISDAVTWEGHAKRALQSVELPMPDGSAHHFQVTKSSIMHPELARQFPTFRSYQVEDLDNPAISGRITITPYGYFASILSPEGMIHTAPFDMENPSMHKVSLVKGQPTNIDCLVNVPDNFPSLAQTISGSLSNGLTKRTYRLAIVTTGEFYLGNGGSHPMAMSVILSVINGIQAIFERELSVGFQLLTPVIYTDPANDPFVSHNDVTALAASVIATNFSSGEYDIGHALHDTDQGTELTQVGAGALFAVCDDSSLGTGLRKGGGWSGYDNNLNPLYINLAAHEFGHMFGMEHTMNGNKGGCLGEVAPASGYEIGSGTTIMAYNGVCDGENIPSSGPADDYFHANSLEVALNFISSETCQSTSSTGNTPPVVNANPCGGTYSIPISTPFRLEGSGFDADGDPIYYCWEQYDEDGAGTPTAGYLGSQAASSSIAPLFRSYPPTTDPIRWFPNKILLNANNYASDFEPLPSVARSLNFRLTGRDFKAGGGGIHCSDISISVGSAGPLSLSAPNGGENLMAGNNVLVSWGVNGTNALCNSVNIRLSVDGGESYPYYLASSTLNDGSENVSIPVGVPNSNTCRVMVESVCNACVVFFDISDSDFTIGSSCLVLGSIIDPVGDLLLPSGDPGLDLSMQAFYGELATVCSVNINGNSPRGPAVTASEQGGTECLILSDWPNQKFETFDFRVLEDGTYKLDIDFPLPGIAISVFVASGFNPAQPCNSIFLGSNLHMQEAYFDDFMRASLVAGTLYKAVIWSLGDDDGTASVTFDGPGKILKPAGSPAPDYSYTYLAMNTLNDQIVSVSGSADFTTLTTGTYDVYGVAYYSGSNTAPGMVSPALWPGKTIPEALSLAACAKFSLNRRRVVVTGDPGPCTPPVILDVVVTSPQCNSPGALNVMATGEGILEYSIDNGQNYQTSSMFDNLAPDVYNVKVRLLSNPTCTTSYLQNPLILDQPSGCTQCLTFTATDLPLSILDFQTTTSTVHVSAVGTISDVNIQGLVGTHTYVGDLRFTLVSPTGSELILFENKCGSFQNFNINLDDQAVADISCSLDQGNTEKPQNSLSIFNGESAQGDWLLKVFDGAGGDQGSLTEWTLEICGDFPNSNCPAQRMVDDSPIISGIYQAGTELTSMGSINPGGVVTFKSGHHVVLKPDFTALQGAMLEIRIEGCN